MNKIILTVFLMAGVLCLTDAACDATALAKCQSNANAAVIAAGNDKSKICPIVTTWLNCVKGAGCPVDANVQKLIKAVEQAAGVTCGSSMAQVSIAVVLFALVTSYLWK